MSTAKPLHIADRVRIFLVGNPNSGKTSLFNALTGSNYKVANYPGVTVEKREGSLPLEDFPEALLVDLPGIYALGGTSLDENIATQALLGQLEHTAPDLIISVVDASNLERNLYLTTQLIDLGLPVVLALNMTDLAQRKGLQIKKEILARLLDLEIVAVIARKGEGTQQLLKTIGDSLQKPKISSQRFIWAKDQARYLEVCGKLGELELHKETNPEAGRTRLVGSAILNQSLLSHSQTVNQNLQNILNELRADNLDALSFEPSRRYEFIHNLVQQSCVRGEAQVSIFAEKLASLSTHPFWGLLIFLGLMAFMFQSIFMWASLPMDVIDSLIGAFGTLVSTLIPPGVLQSLLVDGVIAGVGSVVIFVPQIAILFFFLGILEDSGYLSRAAFLMDRVMRKFGLQGRSFIPLLSSFACAIPGIMSARVIPSFSDRLATIMVAPWMSCSARLPVYTVLIAAFIPQIYLAGFISLQGLVLLSMYLLGVIGAALVARLLRFSVLKGESSMFVMEMPPFRMPSFTVVLRAVWDRVLIFIKSAGTIILACSVVLWFLASFPEKEVQHSYAGKIGQAIEPIIEPLGYNWQIGVGILASFAAREVFVSSLATVYNLEDDDSSSESLITILKEKHKSSEISLATALSLMVFYVFACQCISTLAICRRESGSWGWTVFMFTYMTLSAYIASFITFKVASAYLL